VVRAAIDAGVTTFDVAPLWGDGEAERTVGRGLADTKLEEAVVITRGGVERVDGKLRQSFASDDLVRGCEASLERLGRETIEIFLLHNPGVDELRREAWREAVEALEQDGKIRAWGVSVGSADEARVAIACGARAICLTHHMLTPQALDDLTTEIARSGCGILARSPLSHGLLAGQWSSSRLFAAGDHRARRWSATVFAERVREVHGLRSKIGPEHRDLATAALAFALKHPAVTSALVGARSPAQILAAAETVS
jgi:aryl-alcohol dehydrogenase-like predicted oxidoreductase